MVDGKIKVWESLAIAEDLHEKFHEKQIGPKDLEARALGRIISNEVHSGFSTMRSLMSHDIQKTNPGFDYSKAQSDIDRIQKIWTDCLDKSQGPFLSGSFSIADAMYAPVATALSLMM